MKTDKSSELLFCRQPAKNFNEALPLGNGSLGAMIYGGIPHEKISVNSDTLWSGEPRFSERQDMPEVFSKIRRFVLDGELKRAQELASGEFGDYLVQMYLPLCDIHIDFPFAAADGYERRLSLSDR